MHAAPSVHTPIYFDHPISFSENNSSILNISIIPFVVPQTGLHRSKFNEFGNYTES
jgi:kynurenine formamidase